MAVGPATWLIGKSALARMSRLQVREVVLPRVRAGRVTMAIVTEFEVGFSARSADDFLTTRETVIDYLLPVFLTPPG